jgi:hypothetical protein
VKRLGRGVSKVDWTTTLDFVVKLSTPPFQPVNSHVLLVCLMALRGLADSYIDSHSYFRQVASP